MIRPARPRRRSGITGLAFAVLMVACGSRGTASSGSESPLLDFPITVSARGDLLPGISAAETDLRSALWEPLLPDLGDQADAALAMMNAAVQEAAAEFVSAAGNASASEAEAAPGGVGRVGVVFAVVLAAPLAQAEIGVAGWVSAATVGISALADSGGSRTIPAGDAGIEIDMSGDRIIARIDKTISIERGGLDLSEHITGTIDAALCPDAEGAVAVTIDVTGDASVTDAGGVQVHHTLSLAGTASGAVDDNAELTNKAFDVTVGSARQQTGQVDVAGAGDTSQSFVEVRATGAAKPGSESWNAKGEITRQSSAANTAEAGRLAETGLNLVNLVTTLLLDKAADRWQNGFCIEIVLEGASDQNTVAPGATLSFSGKVMHKHEGVEIPARITAQLSGDQSLEPGDDESPVAYTYTAGSEVNQIATATLEARTRRGVANKTVRFIVEEMTVIAAFTGTFDYDLGGISVHGDVGIPPITLTAGSDGVFTGNGPVELTLSARLPSCNATGSQEGGEITLTAHMQSSEGGNELTFLAEESKGGDVVLICPQGVGINSGAQFAGAAALINLVKTPFPMEEGTYPFQNDNTTNGVHFVVQGEVTLTIPSG